MFIASSSTYHGAYKATPKANRGPKLASDKQRAFLTSLASDRMLPGDERGTSAEHMLELAEVLEANSRLNSRDASAWIERLLAAPKRQRVASPAQAQAATNEIEQPVTTVPAGRYAVNNEDGDLRFYNVEHGKENTKWQGWTFVSVQSSDDWIAIRGRQASRAILAKITADPLAASTRYGREIGRCGKCGRTLTEETSRAAGIGPVCAKAF